MKEVEKSFGYVVEIIENARKNAYRKVNEELILMYREVGKYISSELKNVSHGDAFVDELANYIQTTFPKIRGFNRRGLYRMKQFYETYAENEFVSPLVTQISWTNNLLIMSGSRTEEEREFYIKLCIQENYSKRELERQIESGYYERYILSQEKVLPQGIKKLHSNPFLDSYVMEFLDLSDGYKEKEFRKALIMQMKEFILELGKDFTYIDEEYAVRVGNEDYYIDLLFYHRGLQCLVAIELKTGKFKPEYVSKMDFYLETIDQQIKKKHENPSVGMILCASKDDEVVKYSMSRTMSPLLVSQYQLQLPNKEVLQRKLKELITISEQEENIVSPPVTQ